MPMIIRSVATLLCLSIFFSGSAAARLIEEHIYIVPAGDVEKNTLKKIREKLIEYLPISLRVEIEPEEKMREAAYDPSRQQYNAETVLNAIYKRMVLDIRNERALIVVDVDLFVPGLNFVFGLSDEKKGMCIISLKRLRNEFYGTKPNDKLFIERAAKEAIHELGHSWGVPHCSDPKCVMCFSNSLSDTDKKRHTFCHDCHNKVRSRYDIPWAGGNSEAMTIWKR